MAHIRTGISLPVQPPVVADAAGQAQGGPMAPDSALVARLDAYQACMPEPAGTEAPGYAGPPIRGGLVFDSGAARPRRSTEGGTPAPASREPVAGVPLSEDLGAALLEQFHGTALHTWQRADLIKQVFKEWNSVGPSPRAAKRLQKILAPGHVDTPAERNGAVILDAAALHLIDRGRYAPLVRDYIDTIKRSGDYEGLIDALIQDYPNQTREWASSMVEATLLIWDEALPAELRRNGEPADEPAFDLDGRILKLYRIMNADVHIEAAADEAADQEGDANATPDTATAP